MSGTGWGPEQDGVRDAIARTGDTYDWSETDPSTAVIETIAAIEETDATSVIADGGVTLHDYVDPEALNRLVAANGKQDVALSFSLENYTVWIEGDELTVTYPETAPNTH